MKRPWLRWMPAVAVPAVIAGAVLIAPLQAGASAPLPDRTPADVIAMLAKHQVKALSGTVEQSADLGLPQLPTAPPSSGGTPSQGLDIASVLELFTTPHTARIYTDGAGSVRLQVMDPMAERDLVRSGNDVWFYSSRDNTATHLTVPANMAPGMPTKPSASARTAMPTPEDIAKKLLAAADPTTAVTLGADTQVAGRAVYNLLFTPKTTETLVESAAVYVDGETGLPLGAEVRARGQQNPAFRVAFSQLTLGAPDASIFKFTPPAGATVKELPLTGMPLPLPPFAGGQVATPSCAREMPPKSPTVTPDGPTTPGPQPIPWRTAPYMPVPVPCGTVAPVPMPAPTKPHITGSGWDAVVELPGAGLQQLMASTPLLAQLARPVQGGRLFSTTLANVLLTDDGRVFAGMVTPERLQAVAAVR